MNTRSRNNANTQSQEQREHAGRIERTPNERHQQNTQRQQQKERWSGGRGRCLEMREASLGC
ncbi:ParB-like domain protein [Sesbania bispinosa]|nr:ParB-like domain protein [Sesbania bispinosa]